MTLRVRWTAAAFLLVLAALLIATAPPPMPPYAAVRAAWRPSEAWLYDRNGVLLDSSRVDFARRRLGWTALAGIAPAVPATVLAAEDHRFRSHGGIDWLAPDVHPSNREALDGREQSRAAGKTAPVKLRSRVVLARGCVEFLRTPCGPELRPWRSGDNQAEGAPPTCGRAGQGSNARCDASGGDCGGRNRDALFRRPSAGPRFQSNPAQCGWRPGQAMHGAARQPRTQQVATYHRRHLRTPRASSL